MWDDITKCHGKNCPIKDECLRYVFKHRGNSLQYFFREPPYDEKEKKCEYKMPTKKITSNKTAEE